MKGRYFEGNVRLILFELLDFVNLNVFNDFVFYLMDKWYGYYFIVNVV